MAVKEFFEGLMAGYTDITGQLTPEFSLMINVFIFAILISFYSVFTYKFYRYISKKDLIELNLNKYNTSQHPALNKFFAGILYLIEYIIVLPFLVFFWFAILALIILVLTEEQTINQIVIVTAAIITAIRILAYYEEDLSRDLAKMFPFTVLAIAILTPGFFQLSRILENIQQIPDLLTSLLYFLALIVSVELILRVLDLIANFFRSESERPNLS